MGTTETLVQRRQLNRNVPINRNTLVIDLARAIDRRLDDDRCGYLELPQCAQIAFADLAYDQMSDYDRQSYFSDKLLDHESAMIELCRHGRGKAVANRIGELVLQAYRESVESLYTDAVLP